MAATVWKGFISFGLVSVPIRLLSAARSAHISFHEIHRECGNRVRQQLYCPYHERVVSRDEIALGYEVEKDRYVLVEPEELKKIEPTSSKIMDILQFTKVSDVDPIFFETSYFVVPEEAGKRGYSLLLKTMEEMEYAAIAKVTMHRREQTVIVRQYQRGLTLHTLYYPNEIHQVKEYGKDVTGDLKPQELRLAEQFAKGLVKPFRPEQFHDEYQERVKQLIESKMKGRSAPRPERPKRLAPVVDLMSALKKSIGSKSTGTSKSKRLKKTA
jgi:DNA end-binding protein Ku